MKKIKLSEWAKLNNLCYKTAWTYFKQGKFKGQSEISEKGRVFIYIEDEQEGLHDFQRTPNISDVIDAIKSLENVIKHKL